MNDAPSLALCLHLVPGMFGEGTRRLVERLLAGAGGLSVERLAHSDESPPCSDETPPCSLEELPAWFEGCAPGEVRKITLDGRLGASPPLKLELEVLGSRPEGRNLLGLELKSRARPVWTIKDFEITLMGVACAALSGQSQGAALIGDQLGPVGVGAVTGTVAEQTSALLGILGRRVQVVIVAPDTAASLDQIPSYARSPMADLVEFRLF